MGSKQIGIGLYEFLIESELQHYYNGIKNDLKVQSVSQLKYVTDEDMVQIGMSRPEIRRLKKYFLKHCPQTYLAKIKKKLLHRKEDSISVASLSGYSQNVPGRAVKNVTPGRHIIQAESIVIHKTLGSGEFGTVQQGVWTSDDGQRTQVAIKCLSKERMENNPVEFLKEAAIMHNVDHEHIVRLYGVVLDTAALMLVTELAPLRSLLECLKEPSMRPNLSIPTLYDFAVQICDGMQYLESKRLIHRDLAARNILVFSRTKVKISDFGLSRALGVGKDYYQTNFNVNLKLPIAWCAPECINFLRFTTASDVWAYAVTLWEMFSYGFQPWAALTGQQILEAIDEPNYNRLEKPECCPNEIYYHIMLKCWQHDPSDRPTFSQLSTMILETKPELVQAIREGEAIPRRDFLVYDSGEVITVLDKKPSQTMDDAVLWKGALKDGKTGLFNPANTITYLGSSLPSVKSSQSPFHRNDTRSSSMRKGRISADMISGPQGDLKHTGHVGPDGNFFGDLTFLGSKCWVPRQVVSPYKPDSTSVLDGLGSSSIPGPQSCSRSVKESTSDMSSSDTIPLLETASSMSTDEITRSCSSTAILRRRNQIAVSLPGGIINCADQDHEYHEISDEETDGISGAGLCYRQSAVGLSNPALSSRSQSPLESSEFDKNFDLEAGPSLIDEVFSALQHDCHGQPDEAHNVKNELREMARSKKKFASVKPISSSDRRTLDHAIAIANELASRSMLDLDRSGKNPNSSFDDISSPQTPNSPTHRRKFSFILGSSKGDRERRNYSQEAASIPDIQSTLTEEAKEAYNSLVEKPSSSGLGFLTPSFDKKAASFQFPEKRDDSLTFAVDTVGPHSLTDSPVTLQSSATVTANVTNFPGKFHARSLSKNDADDVVPVNTPLLTTKEEDEIDGNPLRLLRQNKQAYLTNVLPLPPRKGSSQQAAHTTRHQRKHPLLIPGRQNAYASESPPTIRAPAPPPPPKPLRQASKLVGPATASESTECDSNSTIRTQPHCNQFEEIKNETDVGTSSCDTSAEILLATDSNETNKPYNTAHADIAQSVDPISLYENVAGSVDVNEKPTLNVASEVNTDDCCEKAPLLHSSSEDCDVPPSVNEAAGASVNCQAFSGLSQEVNGQKFQNLAFRPDESITVSSPASLRHGNNTVGLYGQVEAPRAPAAQIAQPFRISPGSSIKIKTLQRILGPTATERDCCWALEAVDMDSAHAVKLLRLKALLPEHLISNDATRVVSVLEMSHWDVARAAAFLMSNTVGSAKPAVTKVRLRADVAESLAEISSLRLSNSEDGCLPADSINNNSYQQDSAKRPNYIRPTQV